MQKIKRGFNGQRLAIHFKAQVRHGFIKQAVEGAITRLGFFEKQFLQLVFKLIGFLFPQVFNPRAVVIERRNLHGLLKRRIINAVELKFKEQQLGGNIRELGTHVAIKLSPRRIRRVPHIIKLGIGTGTTEQIGNGFVSLKRLGKFRPRKLSQFPLEFFRKFFGLRLALLHVGLKSRRIGRSIEVSQVPFRQIPKSGRSGHVNSLLIICFSIWLMPAISATR